MLAKLSDIRTANTKMGNMGLGPPLKAPRVSTSSKHHFSEPFLALLATAFHKHDRTLHVAARPCEKPLVDISFCSLSPCKLCGGILSQSTPTPHHVMLLNKLPNLQVKAKVKQCRLHKDSPLGDAVLECYSCASKNVFALGFVPVKVENSAVLLCRDHKAHDAGMKELDLDLTSWQPLIEDRAFVPWLVAVPSEKARPPASQHFQQSWRLEKPDLSKHGIDRWNCTLHAASAEVLMRILAVDRETSPLNGEGLRRTEGRKAGCSAAQQWST